MSTSNIFCQYIRSVLELVPCYVGVPLLEIRL